MIDFHDNREPSKWPRPIDAKLQSIAESAAQKPSWYEAWTRLTPNATHEDRLAVFQAIRDSGLLPQEAGFFLVSHQIDAIATRDADEVLGEYEKRLEAIEAKYRLAEGGIWPEGSAPEGYDELRQDYQRAWDELFATRLEEFGEREMARLSRHDPERFRQLSEAGRQYFCGPKTAEEVLPDVWIRRLVEAIAETMKANSAMGPLGYRYRETEGYWDICVYPTPVELVGGAVDGEVIDPRFSLDLDELQDIFEHIDAFTWQSLGLAPGDGPSLSIEGLYEGREVLLRILAYAPEDEEPGMKFNTVRPRP